MVNTQIPNYIHCKCIHSHIDTHVFTNQHKGKENTKNIKLHEELVNKMVNK
jgi:hypothetical protein